MISKKHLEKGNILIVFSAKSTTSDRPGYAFTSTTGGLARAEALLAVFAAVGSAGPAELLPSKPSEPFAARRDPCCLRSNAEFFHPAYRRSRQSASSNPRSLQPAKVQRAANGGGGATVCPVALLIPCCRGCLN